MFSYTSLWGQNQYDFFIEKNINAESEIDRYDFVTLRYVGLGKMIVFHHGFNLGFSDQNTDLPTLNKNHDAGLMSTFMINIGMRGMSPFNMKHTINFDFSVGGSDHSLGGFFGIQYGRIWNHPEKKFMYVLIEGGPFYNWVEYHYPTYNENIIFSTEGLGFGFTAEANLPLSQGLGFFMRGGFQFPVMEFRRRLIFDAKEEDEPRLGKYSEKDPNMDLRYNNRKIFRHAFYICFGLSLSIDE
ncbi:MAG: hypothetical protein JJU02_15415 [Cryomorphaceae bacterium]|nr:hypothetical protein [Cryomorphaceae bacterium]